MSQSRSTDEFRAALLGDLLLPGDPGFDDSRSVWNAMIDRTPAMVAKCRGTEDVVLGVDFARKQGLELSIKGGGHNISGLAVTEGGLMLDMSLMRSVWVDAPQATAHAQAGCLLADVDRETQIHGLAAVLGFVSNTGIAGLTLGGGFGYLSRRYGWTTDNVSGMDMVTADGSLVHTSETENQELFWALRGGGGNFGVVTGIDYRLYPLGPDIMAGAIAWNADDAEGVMRMFHEVAVSAPEGLNCVAVLRDAPAAPWIDQSVHGKPIVALFICCTEDVATGADLVAPIKDYGSPVGDIVQKRPYVTQQTLLDATQPHGRRYYWKSEYLSDLDPAIHPAIIEHAATTPSPHSGIVLFPLGEAIGRHPMGHSAVGNRDARWVLNITASWEDEVDDDKNIRWAREAWEDLRKFSTGGTYVNFLTEEEGVDRIQAAYGTNYERLTEVKSKWDPENLFRVNKNVRPV